METQLLTRAAGPGRIRGIALELYARALETPRSAGGVLRRGLREARALHSAERRLVSDGLYALIRDEARLDRALGDGRPLARWLGWLVSRGLDPAVAAAAWGAEVDGVAPDFAACDDLDRAAAALPADDGLALRASVSPQVAAELRRAFGGDAESFVAASRSRAPICVRIFGGQRDAVVAALVADGVAAEASRIAGSAVILPTGVNVDALDALRKRRWEVQDDGSQLVADLVQAPPGGSVLDLCAGAGGKTLAVADRLDGVTVFAADVRLRALDELRRRAQALGLPIRVRVIDTSEELGQFDAVLADVPCSGSGTWRRHPELRWRLGELDAVVELQREILARAARAVAPGGQLVYATCSVLPCEDEDVVEDFLRAHPSWRLEEARAPDACRSGPYLRTAPHTTSSDGFFAAVLRRPASA